MFLIERKRLLQVIEYTIHILLIGLRNSNYSSVIFIINNDILILILIAYTNILLLYPDFYE